MAPLNQFVTDNRLHDALEDVMAYLSGEGSEVVPPVIQEKILLIASATQRNENLSSVEIGTPSKGGVVKVYFNPKDLDEATTILENAFIIRQRAQELSSTTDISRKE